MRLFTGEALLVARASAAGVNERDQRIKPPVGLKPWLSITMENMGESANLCGQWCNYRAWWLGSKSELTVDHRQARFKRDTTSCISFRSIEACWNWHRSDAKFAAEKS